DFQRRVLIEPLMRDVAVPDMPQIQIPMGHSKRIRHSKMIMPERRRRQSGAGQALACLPQGHTRFAHRLALNSARVSSFVYLSEMTRREVLATTGMSALAQTAAQARAPIVNGAQH